MKKTIVAFVFGVALGVGILIGISSAVAADYYIYNDAAGKTWIGNQTPPATATVVTHYDWIDATDAEIAQTARDNRAVAAANLARDRVAAQDKLAEAIIQANVLARAPAATPAPIVQNVVGADLRVRPSDRSWMDSGLRRNDGKGPRARR